MMLLTALAVLPALSVTYATTVTFPSGFEEKGINGLAEKEADAAPMGEPTVIILLEATPKKLVRVTVTVYDAPSRKWSRGQPHEEHW
jgi:hypothetical protein